MAAADTSRDRAFVPFSEAMRVEPLDSHTYRVDLDASFCIGAVPNGGYSASCVLAAARAHLRARGQPDTLAAHFEFPRRTAPGPAVVVVEDVRLGRRLSTLHLSLWQDAGAGAGLLPRAPWVDRAAARCAVLAYATQVDLRAFSGLSAPTGYASTAAAALPPPPPSAAALAAGTDPRWAEARPPRSPAIGLSSLRNWRFFVPRGGEPLAPGVLDMWVRAASGERVTRAALAYVVDSFPYNLHAFLAAPEARARLAPPRDRADRERASLWFPTVVLDLQTAAALPDDGVDWLAVRVTSKLIKDGKFDLDVLVRDVHGEIIASSRQIALIVSSERNTGERAPSAKASL
ncbi:thioesterase family protein [Durotheca rogersii]|uniref:thioesterase family protein n=1 Tax=Durotheca rogersii TaxID=419775 RepID=UPI00221F80C6|nr:thioesterase family protein [Durotheca rogersii]KAI5866032.1 thioesterase family protein [Durotheca rogersii]